MFKKWHPSFSSLLPTSLLDFARYADTCFEAFGDRVKYWLTFNEPMTVCLAGYDSGAHAPGRCTNHTKCSAGNSATEPYIVAHNQLNAHAAAVEVYREKYQSTQNGKIGITLNTDFAYPISDSQADSDAAQRCPYIQNGWLCSVALF